MKKNVNKIMIGLLLVSFIILFFIDIKSFIRWKIFYTFRSNCLYLSDMVSKFKVLLILTIFVILFIYFITKCKLKFEKVNILGLEISIKNSEKTLKQNITNYLSTKRTLFKISTEYDNFYDVINSYYNVYLFLRDELEKYELNERDSETYKNANNMIKLLNEFLTKHQSNYKRWFEHIINEKKMYKLDINKIQEKYRYYETLINDFKDINNEICKIIEKIDPSINKWSELD